MIEKNKECDPESLVLIGQVGAPYGIKGWHHIRSFSEPIENILTYKVWCLSIKNKWISYSLAMGRRHGSGIVAQLEGIEDRDSAANLSLSQIAVMRSDFAPLLRNEFYWADLEGLIVQTLCGHIVGHIDSLYENVGVHIMIVKQENKEQHIPFIMDDTVISVDLIAKRVIIDWKLI